MNKYYRVKKDTFIWEEGAILKYNSELRCDSAGSYEGGYEAIEDIWDTTELKEEYISGHIIESQPDWFERVYENGLEKMIFLTKEEFKRQVDKFKK